MFLVKYVATLRISIWISFVTGCFHGDERKKLVVIHPSVDHPRRTVVGLAGSRSTAGTAGASKVGFSFFCVPNLSSFCCLLKILPCF